MSHDDQDPDDRTAILGRSYFRDSLGSEGARAAGAADIRALSPRALVRTLWGSFVAVRQTAEAVTILRDPGGAVPLYCAEGPGFAVLGSALPRWLLHAADLHPRIDFDALAGAVLTPVSATYRSMLKGVQILAAGQTVTWQGGRLEAPRSWWPGELGPFIATRADGEAAAELLATAQGCCRALAAPHQRVTVELSGGLDSSIVTALLAAGNSVELSAVNFAPEHSSGDERLHARSVAEHWRARLVEVIACAADLDFETLFGSAAVEPLFYGLDPVVERASTGVARAFDASAIFTGQGGDAVFYNLATPAVAADHMRVHGLRSLFSAAMLDTAHRTRSSIWAVQAAMLRDRFLRRRPQVSTMPGILAGLRARAAEGSVPDHPWMATAAEWSPGRYLQLQAIANCQMFYGPSERRAQTELVHPLLAQPLVELALSLPSYQLAQGRSDRALARRAFGGLLPESVRRRRGKGDASNYYRRAVAQNLGFLRAILLDGVLVSNGLLDGQQVDQALSEDSLIWSDRSRLIAAYASLEAWVRYWGPG